MTPSDEPIPKTAPAGAAPSPEQDSVAPSRGPEGAIAWDALAHGRTRLLIDFEGQVYQLRVTRNGKLILTK